ncbi:Sorting nexin mvp1 [Dipsacomyces acuminosporus]|nr:Sorting nexin mvp1 [Dipsacomyces acuminosporus]
MSDLYDILDPWGPSNSSTTGGAVSGIAQPSIRSCLDNAILPPVYTVAYSAAMKAGSGTITRDVLQQVLRLAGLPRDSVNQIIMAADPGLGGVLEQKDFNLALAMAALAQKNMSPTVESVAFHKDDLPVPELSGLETLTAGKLASAPTAGSMRSPAAFQDDSDDPWLNAAKSQPPDSAAGAASAGAAAGAATGVATTAGSMAASAIANVSISGDSQEAATGRSSLSPHTRANAAKEQAAANGGRGSVDTLSETQSVVPNINMEAIQWQLDLEDITIKEAAEKGGLVFKHTNYEVSTRSFASMVVRRYNDFFWISNYLVKRYPYRMHPNIPPKGFPGLTRFANAVLRMPYLRRDAVIIQFFSNTDEFSRVIKVGNLDMDAETFDPKEEAGNTPWNEIHQTYSAFDDYYGRIAKDEEKYRTQITALEKIARYKQAIGDELYAYSDSLRVLNMPSESTQGSRRFHLKSKAQRQLSENLNELSMNFGDSSLLEKSQGEVMKTISAEHLRRLYDVVIAMKLMMDRMKSMDNGKDVQRIKERVDSNRRALGQLNSQGGSSSSNGSGAATPTDRSGIEKLERQVQEDVSDLNKLEAEQRCIELRFYQELARYKCYESFLQSHYHRFVEEQIKHHTLALNAWKQALLTADSLPTNPLDFITFP